MNKALFLDRDGVINVDYGHVHEVKRFHFIDGIFELCKLFQKNQFLIIIITNQAGIGKGKYTEQDFLNLNEWMINQFRLNGIVISKTYYCPHTPEENCLCRKPNPGMFLEAIKEFDIDTDKSVLIGDKESDILAGKKAGIKVNILFNIDSHKQIIESLKNLIKIEV